MLIARRSSLATEDHQFGIAVLATVSHPLNIDTVPAHNVCSHDDTVNEKRLIGGKSGYADPHRN
jgi:hypothetical protein